MVTGYLLSVSPIIIAFPSLWLFYKIAIPLSWRRASSLPGAPSPLPTSRCCSRAPGGTHWGCSHTAQLLGPSPRPPPASPTSAQCPLGWGPFAWPPCQRAVCSLWQTPGPGRQLGLPGNSEL